VRRTWGRDSNQRSQVDGVSVEVHLGGGCEMLHKHRGLIGVAGGGELTVVTQRFPEPGCLRNVIYLRVAWPIGSTTKEKSAHSGRVHEYVRNPDGVLAELTQLESVPRSARTTGFTRSGSSVSIDDDGDAYVVRPDGAIERWPLNPPAVDFYCP